MSSTGHRSASSHHAHRRQARRALTAAGVPTPLVDAAVARMACYQHACRVADVPAHGSRAVAELAVRLHPLQAETIDLIVDECRRQGRPIPGSTHA